jgi:mRNA-degrading endonuclease RelE of RelBE toxin-antitoxin system
MPYRIALRREAQDDLQTLAAAQEARVRRALPRYLADQPTTPSAIRRRLDPNPLGAPWELRLAELRVFYEVDDDARTVRVLRVGVKPRETLYLRGAPFEMRPAP